MKKLLEIQEILYILEVILLSKEMKFFLYLLEKYAEWKNENAKNILEKWDRLGVTEKIFDMYEMYHIEALQNAFEDIELICSEKKQEIKIKFEFCN